jgi:hypothetical protein
VVNLKEATLLAAYVEAACPSQQIGEFTPEAWADILPADYSLGECRDAVRAIVRRGSRFVDLGEIIAEVRRARADAAERERTRILLDPYAYRDMIAADNAAFLRKLAARTGGAQLKAIPPPDYDDGQGTS